MKKTFFLNLLAGLAAGAPIAEQQQTGVDATALGQMWITKIEDFINANEDVESGVKEALTNNLLKCSLAGIETHLGAPTSYEAVCPVIYSGASDGVTQSATALGQAWIAKAEKTVAKEARLQTRQKMINSLSNCKILRLGGLLLGDPDTFRTACPILYGDSATETTNADITNAKNTKTNSAPEGAPATPLPEKKEEQPGRKGTKGSQCTSHEDCEGDLKCFTGNLIGDPNECINPNEPTWGSPVTPLPEKKEESPGEKGTKGSQCTSHEDCEGDLKCFTSNLIGDPNECINPNEPTWGSPVTPLPKGGKDTCGAAVAREPVKN